MAVPTVRTPKPSVKPAAAAASLKSWTPVAMMPKVAGKVEELNVALIARDRALKEVF